MKKLIFALLLVVGLASCSKDEEKTTFDISKTVNIREAKSALRSVTVDSLHLSGLEIVKQAAGIWFYNYGRFGDQAVRAGFDAAQRDTITPCLKMWASQIIDPNIGYTPEFIEGEDMVLCRAISLDKSLIDTIAYIPNATLRAAQIAIKTAYDASNYEEVYNLFNTAMTFIPITGAEWRDLKAQNQQ